MGMFDAARFARCRPGCVSSTRSAGELIDEDACCRRSIAVDVVVAAAG